MGWFWWLWRLSFLNTSSLHKYKGFRRSKNAPHILYQLQLKLTIAAKAQGQTSNPSPSPLPLGTAKPADYVSRNEAPSPHSVIPEARSMSWQYCGRYGKPNEQFAGDGEEIQVIYHGLSFLIFHTQSCWSSLYEVIWGSACLFSGPFTLGALRCFVVAAVAHVCWGLGYGKTGCNEEVLRQTSVYFACILILLTLVAHLWLLTSGPDKQTDAQTNKQTNKQTSNEMGGMNSQNKTTFFWHRSVHVMLHCYCNS